MPNNETDLDLGFGSVVADTSPQRLLNRDGSFNVARRGLAWRHVFSLYYTLLSMSWPRFVAATIIGYLGVNLLFALTYVVAGPGSLEGSMADRPFLQAFFFSVQTLSTVGYGNIAPVSVAANILVTGEILAGLFGVSLTVGLVFARFSRPMAEIAFSRNAVVAPFQDATALMFRIANLRRSQIIELSVKVIYSRLERKADGDIHRRFYELSLEREKVTFFPLSWTIVHPIDDASPLGGESLESLVESEAEFLVLLTGIDEGFSQTVHSRTSYVAQDVVWNARFQRIFDAPQGNKVIAMDVSRIDDIEQV